MTVFLYSLLSFLIGYCFCMLVSQSDKLPSVYVDMLRPAERYSFVEAYEHGAITKNWRNNRIYKLIISNVDYQIHQYESGKKPEQPYGK